MEAIIHPGMPKTGTSSIQLNLLKLQPEGWLVPNEGNGNMGGLMAMMFMDNPLEHHSFRARGMSEETMQELRKKKYKDFDRNTRDAFENGHRAICTAEYLSAAPEYVLERLAQFYLDRGFSPRVLAYVRAPVGFMQSAFQQNLKTGMNRLDNDPTLWPNYKNRFEKLDKVFGRDKVTLKVFDPAKLHGGDVCLDFFRELDIQVDRDKIVRVNESMSLEACALLFAQRNLGKGFVKGFEGAQVKNNAFIETLLSVGKGKLRFSRAFLEPMMERHRADLAWMEERLGQSLCDMPEEDHPDAITTGEDLLTAADRARDLLESLLTDMIRKEGGTSRDRLVRNMELLRMMHY